MRCLLFLSLFGMANKEKPQCPLGAPRAQKVRRFQSAARPVLFRFALAVFLPPAAAGQHAHEQLYVLDVVGRKGVFGLGIGAEQLGSQGVHLFRRRGGRVHGRALIAGKPCLVYAQGLCQKAQAARLGAEIALQVLAHGAFGDAGGAAQVCLAQVARLHGFAQALCRNTPLLACHAVRPLSCKSVHRARGRAAPAAVRLL